VPFHRIRYAFLKDVRAWSANAKQGDADPQDKQQDSLERGFAYTLKSGGMRRTTLHGIENIGKPYQIAGFCVNISLLMRGRFGFGTAKQCAAMGKKAVNAALDPLVSVWQSALFHFCRQFQPIFGFSRHGVCNHVTVGLC